MKRLGFVFLAGIMLALTIMCCFGTYDRVASNQVADPVIDDLIERETYKKLSSDAELTAQTLATKRTATTAQEITTGSSESVTEEGLIKELEDIQMFFTYEDEEGNLYIYVKVNNEFYRLVAEKVTLDEIQGFTYELN